MASPQEVEGRRPPRRSNSQGSNVLAEKYKLNGHHGSGSGIKNPPEYVRGGSRDNIRRIVEKEGKTARNLIAYSVPPSEESQNINRRKGKHKYRPNTSELNHNNDNNNNNSNNTNINSNSNISNNYNNNSNNSHNTHHHYRGRAKNKKQTSYSSNKPRENGFVNTTNNHTTTNSNNLQQQIPVTPDETDPLPPEDEEQTQRETKSEEYKERIRKAIEQGSEGADKLLRSSSTSSMQSQKELRARYWSYLFENFHRSVDEIYATCENDESIIECQEVMLMLDVCKRDFEALIHRLKLFTQIEASEVRPQSLAWEVRKQMSPGKCQSPTVNSVRSPSPAAARFLNFGAPVPAKFSWADRVRGFSTKPIENEGNEATATNGESASNKVMSLPIAIQDRTSVTETIQEVEEETGWEVVRKGRSKSKSSSLVSSASSSHSILRKPYGDNGEAFTKNTLTTMENTKQTMKNNPLIEKENENEKENNIPANGHSYETSSQYESPSLLSKNINGHDDQPYDINGNVGHDGVQEFSEISDCNVMNGNGVHGEEDGYSESTNALEETALKLTDYTDYTSFTPDACMSPRSEHYRDISLTGDYDSRNDIDHTSEYSHSISKIDIMDDSKGCPLYGDSMDYLYGLTENEILLKEENERALATVIAEEKTLTKELEEEALKDDDDDMSSERDYTTDITTDDGRETPKDVSDELPLDCSTSLDDVDKPLSWDDICAQYDRDRENAQKFSWGDRMEMSESVRRPGRALEMHQKLSSRKKSRSESVKRSEERMARAERRRLKLLVDKCERLRDLSCKVQKVRELKNMLIAEKERNMVEQMKRAEINRQIALQEKIKKAQEEELKVNEIAFINTLEAQNRKMEVQEKQQVSEARLQDLVEERQKRKEGKHAKEEAAQERRRALEQERLARLQEIKQKRGDQAAKWQKERSEREKAREEQAKEKQRERDLKVAARNEAMQVAAEELLKRIELKHIESTKRHEQRIEEVKEKSRAASSSRHATVEDTPSSVPYDKMRKCTLCDVDIASDVYLVSHLKGLKHRTAVKDVNKKITDAEIDAFSSKYIKEAEPISMKKIKEQDDRAKAMKKRAKKIKARMTSKGKEYENVFLSNAKTSESAKQGKLQKCVKDINKVLQAHSNGPWPANKVASLDKTISEISRSLEDKNSNDQKVFCHLGGLAVLSRVLLLWDTSCVDKLQKSMVVPPKIIKHASESIEAACASCNDNCLYMLQSNKVSLLVDLLAFRLKVFTECHMQQKEQEKEMAAADAEKVADEDEDTPSTENKNREMNESVLLLLQQDDGVTLVIMNTLAAILKAFRPKWPVKEKKNDVNLPDLQQRLIDLVSYVACSGILDQLIKIYRNIQGPFEDINVVSVIETIINLFQQLVFCVVKLEGIFTKKKDDTSMISETMRNTEAFGLVALMYSLLHQGSATRISPSPLPLAESTTSLLTQVIKTLNILALIDLPTFQNTVASEGTSLQYQSVIGYLLRYASLENRDELLHEVIICLGNVTVQNEENQLFIQSGRPPSLLQQLCTLPFKYFSDTKLKNILFPTVICICYKNAENMKIVAQDVSPTLLAIYIEEIMKEKSDSPVVVDDMDQRSMLDLRFPRCLWEEAKVFFTEPETTSPIEHS